MLGEGVMRTEACGRLVCLQTRALRARSGSACLWLFGIGRQRSAGPRGARGGDTSLSPARRRKVEAEVLAGPKRHHFEMVGAETYLWSKMSFAYNLRKMSRKCQDRWVCLAVHMFRVHSIRTGAVPPRGGFKKLNEFTSDATCPRPCGNLPSAGSPRSHLCMAPPSWPNPPFCSE